MTFSKKDGKSLTQSLADAFKAAEQRVKRVLVADDNEMTVSLFTKMIHREFYGEAIPVATNRRILEMLDECDPFDAVILDYALLNGPSISTYQAIKDKWKQTKVIFLTGYDSPDVRAKIEAVGTARVHSKSAMTDLRFMRELLEEIGLKRRVAAADGI